MVEFNTVEPFATLSGFALVALVGLLGYWAFRALTRARHFRRSAVYKVWPGKKGFKILRISTMTEAKALLDYLLTTFELEMMEHDPEPDETSWRLGNPSGTIDLFYDDHEGARIESTKGSSDALFRRLVKEIPKRRSFFY